MVVSLLLAPNAEASTREIKIGLAVPLTGRMAQVGIAMQRALESAVSDANTAGGVDGAPIALVVANDGCASSVAAGSAATLAAEQVAVVIGHPCSGAATAAAKHYGEANRLFIAVGARHPDVTSAYPTAPVLRLAGRDDRQGDAAARWLIDRAPSRRIAIVHDRTAYARAILDRAQSVLSALGSPPATVLPIVAGNRDYTETLDAIADARIEAVLFAGFVEEAIILIAGLAESGRRIPLLGTDSLATAAFASFAQRASLPIEILLPTERPPGTSAETAPVGDDAAPERETLYAASTRAAFEAWLATVRRLGSTDAALAHRALIETPVHTDALGSVRFDEAGDLIGNAFVPASAQHGRWTPRH